MKYQLIISFCIDKINWDNRIIGYVDSIQNENVSINEVDVFGSVVKKLNIRIDKILIVETNDSYNEHLQKLKKEGDNIKKEKTSYYFNKGEKFFEKINLLKSESQICTIFFDTQYITGIIADIKDDILFVKSLGYSGTNEGEAFCKIDSISKIRYKGPFERKIEFLKGGDVSGG
ncbi:MAG: hypothetical protein QM528_08755 [Phycisphaerales bacterium]|nr:hypothetical protein [Phycisphaerales bacterium]